MSRVDVLSVYAKNWIDSHLKKEYFGAQFSWTKEKAKEFANVSIEDLLFDEYFLNAKEWLYPGIIDLLFEVWEEMQKRPIEVICILGGFGTGKTSGFGAVMNWLNWYRFTCRFKEDSPRACPQEYYGLIPTKQVAFIALSKTVEKSKDITFSSMIHCFHTQFNKDYFPVNPRVKSKIVIPGNNTVVFPNTATEAANAGYDIFSFVMDEVSFLQIVDRSSRRLGNKSQCYDQAKEAYESALGRMRSRFKKDGLGILLSSLNYDEDFLMTKIKEAYQGIAEEEIFFKILLPWKVHPDKFNMTKQYFYFDTDKLQIIEDPGEVALLNKYYVERPVEDIIFGDRSRDPNDRLLEAYRNGVLTIDDEGKAREIINSCMV